MLTRENSRALTPRNSGQWADTCCQRFKPNWREADNCSSRGLRRSPNGATMGRMVARLHVVFSGLLMACSCEGNGLRISTAQDAGATGGSGGSQATSPLGAHAVTGGSGGSAGTGGGLGGVGGDGGGTGGQLATATSTAAGVCVPGASVACACVTGQQGAQVCTSAGTFGACACWVPTMDAAGAVGGDDAASSPGGTTTAGGASTTGGTSATAGSASATAGIGATGGAPAAGGLATTGGAISTGGAPATGGATGTSAMTLAEACTNNCALASGLATCSTTTTVCEQSCISTYDNTSAVNPDLGRMYTAMMVCIATKFTSSADFICAKPNSAMNKWSPGPDSDCEQLICDWNCDDAVRGDMDPWVDIRCYCTSV